MTALVSAGRLMEVLLSGEPVTLLDVRWSLAAGPGHAAYRAGHLPGAVFVNLDTDLSAPPGRSRSARPPLRSRPGRDW